jgi:hypothetical protein
VKDLDVPFFWEIRYSSLRPQGIKTYSLLTQAETMTAINTTGSSLKADTKAAAFLEACILLDVAEKTRNSANPGIAAKNNVSINFSSEDGVAAITVQLPSAPTSTASGLVYTPTDYLGGAYGAFTAGGDVTATTAMAAVSQVASILSAAEKAVQPVEDQPNNIQIESSSETGFIVVTATVPVTQSIDADGNIKFVALDYV